MPTFAAINTEVKERTKGSFIPFLAGIGIGIAGFFLLKRFIDTDDDDDE